MWTTSSLCCILRVKNNAPMKRYSMAQHGVRSQIVPYCTLLETNIAPENGWLEEEFSFWDVLFSGAMLVSWSVILKKGATKNQQEHDRNEFF